MHLHYRMGWLCLLNWYCIVIGVDKAINNVQIKDHGVHEHHQVADNKQQYNAHSDDRNVGSCFLASAFSKAVPGECNEEKDV